MNRRNVLQMLAGGLAVGSGWPIRAQGDAAKAAGFHGGKPIRIVVPFPAAGAADQLARPLARMLGEKLGTTVIVENKPGANTVIGAAHVVTSPADGLTLLLANEAGLSLAPALAPLLKTSVPYKAATDFFPVSLLGQYGSVLTINPSLPVRNLQQFIAYAKANPGKLNYASFGIGSQPQMMMEILNHQAKIDTVHVPYKGVAPAILDLMSGQVHAMISAPSAPLPYVRDGRLRAIAYSGAKRLPELPDVPTFAEGGLPDFEARGWFGIVVHAATPAPIKALLCEAIWSIVQSPEYQAKAILANGYEVPAADPVAFQAFLANDMAKWKATVATVGPRLL